jgi:peptide/nickel transport system substrate-binding protein
MKHTSISRTRARLAAVFVATFALVAGATSGLVGSIPAAADDKTVFTVGILNDVDSFNPFLGIEAESYEMWALMYDYMITYNMKTMAPEPGLATSWETSDDGLTWTFHIRTGVKWSDGQPLTAADIAYTYNRVLDGGPESASWGSYLKSVKTITAPDAKTVVLALDKPNAVLPLLPIPIVPEHIWKDVSEDDVKTYANETDVVGSGPFRLVSGRAGGSLYKFEVNPDYWGGRPNIDEIIFRVFNAEDPAVQALVKGEVDFVDGITPIQVKALQGKDGITAILGNSPGFDEIAFNVGSVNVQTGKPMGDPNPALMDPKFRYALQFAIDRDAIAERVYQGGGEPASSIIPTTYSTWHWEPPSQDAPTYDPDKAASLLDAAGYKLGSDGKRTMPDGSPIGTLRLYARGESPTSVDTMNFFKEWLGDLGIDASITNMESGKLTNVILDGTYDIFQWGWYVEPDPDSILSYFTCGQRGNWSDSWYCDKRYDRLYNTQHSETDDAKRVAEVKRMEKQIYYDAPYLVTVYSKIGEAYRSDRWTGFVPQPDPGGVLLFQYGVYNYVHIKPVTSSTAAGGSGSASGSSSGSSNTTAIVLSSLISGLVLFVVGGLIGGWVGYRRASVKLRE